MVLTKEEKNKRKLEHIFVGVGEKKSVSTLYVKKLYKDYMELIGEFGIEFIEEEFIDYCVKRIETNDKTAIDKETITHLLTLD